MNEIKYIAIKDLIAAPDNPFKVQMDAEMEQLIESIAENGVITPIIARETKNGKYEIISGHRRKFACEYLGLNTVPVLLRELNRNEAVITLVDSNLQREHLLPSEKAFGYKLKMDALSAQGKRTDLTCGQVGHKSRDMLSETESGRQIQRYIHLTYLIPDLLQKVDEGQIAFTPAVELSYLTEQEQQILLSEMEYADCTPSLSQAIRLHGFSQEGRFNGDVAYAVMSEEKANQQEKLKIPAERVRKFFPKDYTPAQMEEEIVKMCESRYRKRQRDRDSR